jgi:surfeit locus 1 family protein
MRRYSVFFLAIPVAAVCVYLGLWQLSRLKARRVHNTSVRAVMALPPLDLVAATDQVEPFRSVKVAGRFDYSRQIVVDARVMDGIPSVIVVTPLELGDGNSAVLVERGWVPSPDAHTVNLGPLEEDGTASVVGTVVAAGPDIPALPDSTWPKHVQWPSPASLASLYPYRLLPFVVARTGAASRGTALRPVAPPELTDGPHLSYMVQWFSFAVIAIVGSVFLYKKQERPSPRTRA